MNQENQAYQCKSPVGLLIFNRPETTKRVFAEIAKAKPRQLFVIADGPRRNRPGEDELCRAVRKTVENVDWECELSTNYAEENMGCARRVSSGINWVFENVEEAIILEDDCLPHPTFFRFCDEMLERYRNDERIMAISGDNFQFGRKRWEYSYYFSRYAHVWGWASWRRAWTHYDAQMSYWPMVREKGWLADILGDKGEAKYWTGVFDRTHEGKAGTWDYQWMFACWLHSGLSILPNVNLISNIGFGVNATHTGGGGKVADIPTEDMSFPLTHPPILIRDSCADGYTARLFFHPFLFSQARSLARRWIEKIQHELR
jgi:hypothetical protein